MAIDNFSVSFSNTEGCLKEINEILNDIQSKLRDNSVLDKHEELKRILFSKLLLQYTQEFNDNAEKLWKEVIKQHPKIRYLYPIYFLTCSAKGISSNQLGKELGISQKSAWFMLHRLREILNGSQKKDIFGGTTEVDECYVGGSDTNKHKDKKFTSQKTAIIGLVNRDTKQAKAFVVDNADKECLLPKIGCNVKEKSLIVTDSYHAYNDLRNNYKHKSIKHSANEYVRNELDINGRVAFKVHTNTVEGFWSIVKRTVNGTHHWISKKHTNRYLNDMTFRYNQRQLNSQNKFDVFTSSFDGRLKYVELTKKRV